MMQKCTKCGSAKPLNEFYVRDKVTNKVHRSCKECYKKDRQSYAKEHYKKYGEQYRKRAIERKNFIRNQLRKQISEYLSDKSCFYCGYSDIRALEFDHINPSEKSFGIARALSDCRRWEEIAEEISKCRILCANCHKIRTSEQFKWYRG